MIQLLIIGRSAGQWASKLEVIGPAMSINTARLPAAGIREIERSPPDAVILEAKSSTRALSLAIAVKSRPIGEFIPVIAIAPDDAAENAPGRESVEDLLPPTVDAKVLMRTLETALGLEPNELETQETPRTLSEPTSPSMVEESEFELEEIIEGPEDDPGPQKLSSRDIFGERAGERARIDVDEATIRRKLRAVRHEDYFAILEIPRASETPAVRDAFHRMRDAYTKNIEFDLAHRYQEDLREIHDAFEDAWAVLGDPDLRASYLQHTTK